MDKCHVFTEKNDKYFCKYCGIDSKTAEVKYFKKYANGIAYAYENDKMIGGFADKLYNASFMYEWKSNMGDLRQSVYWTIDGQNYYGVYYKSNSDVIKWRKIK